MNVTDDLHSIENNWYMEVNSMEELKAAVYMIAHHIPFEEVDIDDFLERSRVKPTEFPIPIGVVDGNLVELGFWHTKVNEVKLEFRQTLEVINMELVRDITTVDGSPYYTDILDKARVPEDKKD